MTTIEIELPETTAQAPRAAELLTPEAFARLLDDALLSIADRVAAAGIAPMSMDEITAEVKAVRAERRAHQGRDDDSGRS